MTDHTTTPEQAEQIVNFTRTFFDLLQPAMQNYEADVNVRDLVVSAENVIEALERVDTDHTLPAAEHTLWKLGNTLSDSTNDGMRAFGVLMLVDAAAAHPEVTGPLITRLADRLRRELLDERT